MAEPQQYFLKWNNYLRQLTCALDNHRAHDEFVDVTLLCEGRKITAHKVVLSSCSSYFKHIFSESPHPHPLLIFNFIKYEDLNSIIMFMYQGEVNVKQEGLDSFLQLAKVLSVHGLNTEGTDNDSIPSNIDNDTIPESVRVLRSTSADTNRQRKIQPLLKVAHENQTHRNLSTSIDKTTTDPTPSCSQSSYKKRKLTDTYNDNAVSPADDRDEQAAVNADDIASRDCMITNLPEYILGQSNDQPSAVDPLQEMNQNLDYNAYNVANIKTEYEILVESDTEEKYTPTDDAEMTIESRCLTNLSTPQVPANLDLTPSCSNAAATGTEGASSDADSSLTSSESNSDVISCSSAPQHFTATNESTNVLRTVTCIGEAEFLNFSKDKICITKTDDWLSLPSIQEIRRMPDIQRMVNAKALENKERVKIAKALITFILNKMPNRQLVRGDFVQLSQSIVEIFPYEVKETYYIPFTKGHLAKGKLYDAYNNLRNKLSSSGLIKRRVRTVSEKHKNHVVNDADVKELEVIKSDGYEWVKVLEVWEKSHSLRQNELKNSELSTVDYLQKYKVLLNEKSYKLIEIDFKILFPLSKNIYEWKLYYLKVIAKAEKLKDNNSIQEILSYIKKTDDEDSKLALALMLVPYILPNSRKNTKINKLEIQESFIYYSKNILEADDETRHRLKRFKTESQPKIHFVGDTTKSISVAFVDISGTKLKFENPLKAVEVCFHCFMAMNIKFPKYCAHVWTFLQKFIFDISTPWDNVTPAVSTLINDLHSDPFFPQ